MLFTAGENTERNRHINIFSLQGCLADVNNWIVTIINKTEKIAVIKIQLCPQYMQGSTHNIEDLTIYSKLSIKRTGRLST